MIKANATSETPSPVRGESLKQSNNPVARMSGTKERRQLNFTSSPRSVEAKGHAERGIDRERRRGYAGNVSNSPKNQPIKLTIG